MRVNGQRSPLPLGAFGVLGLRKMETWLKFIVSCAVLMATITLAAAVFSESLPTVAAPPNPSSEKSGRAQATQGKSAPKGSDTLDQAIVVETAVARPSKTTSDIRAIGTLQSDESVQIASEIAGRIASIEYKEGQPVRKGDVLLKLDEALARAELADAKSRSNLAIVNNERTSTLSKQGYATGRSRDEAVSTFETAQAALQLAETRLAKHTLTAPFDGVAGVRNVSAGAFIPIGQALINIEKIDTLKVDFRVPELYLAQIEAGQKIEVAVDALNGQTFPGEIYAIDPLIDVNGRALKIRARLPNGDGALRPGLFARITIKGLTERDVVMVPESAIVPRGADAYVFKIDNGRAIESRVKLGARFDAQVEILEGLEAAATVVVAGQQKLRNGSAVEVVAAKSSPAWPAPSQPAPGSG